MTQLILDGVYMPQRSNGAYACWEAELSQQVEMISGRAVKEYRGKVWRASASYDYLDQETYTAALAVLRRGKAFSANVLPDNGTDSMVSSTFIVESLTPATFGFTDKGKAVWRGLAFQIREVKPHA